VEGDIKRRQKQQNSEAASSSLSEQYEDFPEFSPVIISLAASKAVAQYF
jgi:hypothetical protein